jgi:membrane fusion protein, multidrug efflux system
VAAPPRRNPRLVESKGPGEKSESPAKKRGFLQNPVVIIGAALVLILGIAYGAKITARSLTHETTDDAFIDAHIVAIAPKIAGRVIAVHVTDNQTVRKGDLLVEIDPADAESVVAQQRAGLAVAQAKARTAQMAAEQADAHLQTLHAGYEAAAASADAAAADTRKLRGDLVRNQELINSGAISKQDYEHSTIDTKSSEATLDSKKKQMDAAAAYLKESEKQAQSAHVQVSAAEAEVAQAEAMLKSSELSASYAKITAPSDGRITNKAVEPGSYIQTGQNLLALVPPQLWVTANFKETQLAEMRPGQPVMVSVDAYPERELRGHVDSIQAGSGARFSLLPPENATGNYVKVVQRVPVKIVLDEQPDVQQVLGPGMSAAPDVRIKSGLTTGIVVAVIALVVSLCVFIGAALWIGRGNKTA